jgi:hypothetical protein
MNKLKINKMATLNNIPPAFWNTSNITSFSDIFANCISLTTIPPNLFTDWEKEKLKYRRLKIEKIKNKYEHLAN